MVEMTSTARNRKVTFSLPPQLMEEVKELVQAGVAASQNAFVEQALMQRVREARKELLRQEFQEAARDPLFLRDIEETMADFAAADAETARMIP
jgi:Arc/MetJ-type ribon-helix-helix transcriptional regulator